ncbi:uncharacterized protein UBRO_07052 [Ustilago bromivora]|uniref:Ubiquitin-like-conjugating enzyme ATG10 n=1 Tax=Ustilago bromivora TaxID=307758 RepID=A0A1K0GCF3_9BASI|nr:uncharacterized protein UBRO_07052 [Ustilago bromivora]
MAADPPPPQQTRARLTFDQFQFHCQSYLNHRDSLRSTPSTSEARTLSWMTYAQDWTYLSPIHPNSPAFYPTACLHRSFPLLTSPTAAHDQEELLEEPTLDPSEANSEIRELVTITQSITWSSLWQLPILYFYASDSSGQPLGLEQIKEVNIIYRRGTLPSERGEVVGGGVSVGDHPRNGLPVFYLHPCETEGALSTLLIQEQGEAGMQERQEGWRYMAAFISLCASAVEMRAS